jgi:hypothetical protein
MATSTSRPVCTALGSVRRFNKINQLRVCRSGFSGVILVLFNANNLTKKDFMLVYVVYRS